MKNENPFLYIGRYVDRVNTYINMGTDRVAYGFRSCLPPSPTEKRKQKLETVRKRSEKKTPE
jgi:hypothetical protein